MRGQTEGFERERVRKSWLEREREQSRLEVANRERKIENLEREKVRRGRRDRERLR